MPWSKEFFAFSLRLNAIVFGLLTFALRESRVRVISARHAHKKERIQYEEILSRISERV
jgi:uncharacterized DUF497 family protein